MTDVLLDSDGDLAWADGKLSTVTGDEEVLQRVWIALSIGLGEWAFDTSAGFAYLLISGVRRNLDLTADRTLIEGEVRRVIEPITGVDSIRAIDLTHDPLTKTLTIDVDTVYGTVPQVTT